MRDWFLSFNNATGLGAFIYLYATKSNFVCYDKKIYLTEQI